MTTKKTPAGHFNLLYFAASSSYTKKGSEYLKAPFKATELFDTLEKMYPGIKARVLESCAVTLNLEYIDLDDRADIVFKEGDEVAIIPPVSSG